MLPFFLRHYRPLVDHIFVYDNGSTDGSLELLAGEDRVTVFHFDVTGDSFVDEERRLSDAIWQRSRDLADWVIVVDMDEHLYHPNLKGYLRNCTSQGITAITAVGYEMSADVFPTGDSLLWQEITSGCRFLRDFDKLGIFNPNAIEETNYSPGRHNAFPQGRVVYPKRPEVKLLHYKKLGLDYLVERWAELRTGLRAGDLALGYGSHYLTARHDIEQDFTGNRKMARTVPGLCARDSDVQRLDLHLEIEGERIDPEYIEGASHGFRVSPNTAPVWVASEPLNAKHLFVGVPVVRIGLRAGTDDYEIPLDSSFLGEGWWRPSLMFDQMLRWTDRKALIKLPEIEEEGSFLEIEVAERMVRAWA